MTIFRWFWSYWGSDVNVKLASLNVDDIGQICQLGLYKNLGLLQHDFNHILRVKGEMLPFLRCFPSLLSSDGDPWDNGCVVFLTGCN